MEGFAGTLGAEVSTAAQDIGLLGWLLSFTISFILYYGMCKMWPTANQRIVREMGLGWEYMATTSDIVEAVDGMNKTVEEVIVKGSKV
jgi:NCS1 family nucleobase:cation symporter-1